MPDNEAYLLVATSRTPWNKGKLIGAKPPLRPKHVWAIRTRLMIERRSRDLAMFNLAIDVVALKVEDVAPNGYTIDRATIRQRKTGRPVKFELTEQTREAVDGYLRASGKKPGELLFTSRRDKGRCMTTRQYARLVSEWITGMDLILSFSAPIPSGGRRRR
jgi:integrase